MYIVFVGDVIPEKVFAKVSKVNPSTNNVQLNFIRYLHTKYQDNLIVISRNWGMRKLDKSKSKWCNSSKLVTNEGISIETISFNKSRMFMNLSAIFSLYRRIKLIRKSINGINENEKIVFVVNNPFYGLTLPIFLAKRKKDALITILCEGIDIRYLQEKKWKFHEQFTHLIHKYILKRNDGIITFNSKSVEKYSPKVPFVELFHSCETRLFDNVQSKRNPNTKTLLYAGLVSSCYGIENMLEVIKNLPENYRLVICGGGDKHLIELILSAQKKDSRIKYLGLIPRKDAIELQVNSDLLLMIRTASTKSDNYIAKYSQPSKLSEYMLSGTPIIATDIPAIPISIKPYLNFSKANVDTLVDIIIDLLETNKSSTLDKARKARTFALSNCDTNSQQTIVISFIDNIIKSKWGLSYNE